MYQSNMLQPMCYVGEEFLQTQYNTHKIKITQCNTRLAPIPQAALKCGQMLSSQLDRD